MLVTLATLEKALESVPINQLIKILGTPLKKEEDVDSFDFIRTIALSSIMCGSLLLDFLQTANK